MRNTADAVVMIHLSKALSTAAVCALGAACMYLTGGTTGVGWAILGVFFIWGL